MTLRNVMIEDEARLIALPAMARPRSGQLSIRP
jgi:hypothetical protein